MSEGGEKTEQPTPKKIRDARKKGQVANSKDTVSTSLLIAIFAYIWVGWDYMLEHLKIMMLLPSRYMGEHFYYALREVTFGLLVEFAKIVMPIILVTVVAAIASNFLQIGPLVAFESLKPDLNKLNPVSGMKKIFAMKNVFEFLKSSAKVIFLGALVFYVTKGMIDPLFKIPPFGMEGVMEILPKMMRNFASFVMLAYIIVAVADFFFQRHNHNKQLMMTKDEVKREYKESEGDPHIKGKRKQLHKEMVMEDNVQNTRKSTVVVTNPSHLAIALKYVREEKKLPVVTAKGEGILANRMRKAAEEAGVPIMENVDLARQLFDEVQVKQYIPSDLIQPVAEVLRWVQMQSNR